MPENCAAFVLAGGHVGGYGVLSKSRAKAALPFAGMYRVVDFAISTLRNAHVEKIGIIIQYLPKSLIEHVGVGFSWDLFGHGRMMRIMPPFVGIGKTDWYKGTGDAIYRNLDFARRWAPDNIIICSGDHIHNFDFADLVRFHRENDADLTVVSKNMKPEEISPRFGRVVCDEKGFVVREFIEKPPEHSCTSISINIYVFKTNVLFELLGNMIQNSLGFNLARHVIAVAPERYRVLNYSFDGYWNYLGNVNAYYDANMSLLDPDSLVDLASWEIATNMEDRGQGYRPPAMLGDRASVIDSLISVGCRIDGKVSRSVLSPGVVVEEGAVVENSIIMHDCHIGKNANLQFVISDKDAVFEENTQIGRQLGLRNHNGDYAVVNPTLVGKGIRIDVQGREQGAVYED